MRAHYNFVYFIFLVVACTLIGVASYILFDSFISPVPQPVKPPVMVPVKPPVVVPVKPPVVVPPTVINQKGEYKVDVKIDINIRYPEIHRFNPCSLLF